MSGPEERKAGPTTEIRRSAETIVQHAVPMSPRGRPGPDMPSTRKGGTVVPGSDKNGGALGGETKVIPGRGRHDAPQSVGKNVQQDEWNELDTKLRESLRVGGADGAKSESAPPPPTPSNTEPPNPEAKPRPETHARAVGSEGADPLAGSETRLVNPAIVLDRLSLLLHLQKRARVADDEELPFVIVNETRQLLKYRQAALFAVKRGKPRLQTVSGLAVPDANAPYVQWLARFVKWRMERVDAIQTERVNLLQLGSGTEKLPSWFGDWQEWLPPYLIWGPLNDPRGGFIGILLAFRDEAFSDSETMIFSHLMEGYSQTMALSQRKRRKRSFPLSPVIALLVIAAIAGMFYPVHQSVLAPSEITAKRPALVRAGLDGVIDRFLVEPNQEVEAGTPLIHLEDAQLRTRLAVAKKAEDMAQVEYRQLLQAALSDPKTKQRIPLIQGRMEQLAAETAFIEKQMERVVISSPIKGVVLCDNPDEWLGRPVSLGQRIMLVADPNNLEVEIRLPASDSLQVSVGDQLMFYPNISPIEPMSATVSFVGYRAGEVPGVGMAFILRADVAGDGKPLLGLRGMAKLYGTSQPLGLVLLRKPIMAVRQWLGL